MLSSNDAADKPAARCVDCGRPIADEKVFRVLRRGRDGQRHVICRECADRRHAEAKPAPLQIQRTPPPPSVLTGKRLAPKGPEGPESNG